jgi:hypothetical protein
MRQPKPAAGRSAVKPAERACPPEVIVDFIFEQGLFHIAVVNISSAPAYRVVVSFDRKFCGLGGQQEFSALRLFRGIEFLAPHKRIETFLDRSTAYFQRREPTRIAAKIAFRDAQGRAYERRLTHDLSIYKTVSYLLKPAGMNSSVIPAPAPAAPTTTIVGSNYVSIESTPLL